MGSVSSCALMSPNRPKSANHGVLLYDDSVYEIWPIAREGNSHFPLLVHYRCSSLSCADCIHHTPLPTSADWDAARRCSSLEHHTPLPASLGAGVHHSSAPAGSSLQTPPFSRPEAPRRKCTLLQATQSATVCGRCEKREASPLSHRSQFNNKKRARALCLSTRDRRPLLSPRLRPTRRAVAPSATDSVSGSSLLLCARSVLSRAER